MVQEIIFNEKQDWLENINDLIYQNTKKNKHLHSLLMQIFHDDTETFYEKT